MFNFVLGCLAVVFGPMLLKALGKKALATATGLGEVSGGFTLPGTAHIRCHYCEAIEHRTDDDVTLVVVKAGDARAGVKPTYAWAHAACHEKHGTVQECAKCKGAGYVPRPKRRAKKAS